MGTGFDKSAEFFPSFFKHFSFSPKIQADLLINSLFLRKNKTLFLGSFITKNI